MKIVANRGDRSLDAERIRQALDSSRVVGSACDLDLLLFFARHPRVLLTTDQLAGFVGYELKDVTGALESLLAAGLVTRLEGRTRTADLYTFDRRDEGGSLSSLLASAATREGRLAVLRVLEVQAG